MGDNGRRERAWPRREGECPSCRRWLVLLKTGKLPRHQCKDGYASGAVPSAIYPEEPRNQ
jgi:hypothetical protein